MSGVTGARQLTVRDSEHELDVPVLVFYPTGSRTADMLHFGPYSLPGRMNAPPGRGCWPLVVISHGSGGSHLAYRTLAAYLARHGYVVALPEHPGNNRTDNALAEHPDNLRYRPWHVSLVIDALYLDPELVSHLQPAAVAVIGHSMGGYTALAVAGGVPRTGPGAPPVPVVADARVRALVLFAPATPWYQAPAALADVGAPILMLTAEHDPHTPPMHARWVLQGLPPATAITHREVAGAGHFSFLSPFPLSMLGPSFPPGNDPPGFDRQTFHDALFPEVLAFLHGALGATYST